MTTATNPTGFKHLLREADLAKLFDQLPPSSPQAEAAVLGSMIQDWRVCADVLQIIKGAESFHKPAHAAIYQELIALYDQQQSIDMVQLNQRLVDKKILEQVGGLDYLIELAESVPSAASVGHYARIVRDKAVLRKLAETAGKILYECHHSAEPAAQLLDAAERSIFEIADAKIEDDAIDLAALLQETYSRLENEDGRNFTGLPSGYFELDEMTNGLQPGEMVIIAARPSMGKCLSADSEIVLVDGSVCTIEQIHARQQATLFTLQDDRRFSPAVPEAFVDDGIKPVFRVRTGLGREIKTTLPHPFLTPRGWKKLRDLVPGDRIAVPRRLGAFGQQRLGSHRVKLLAYLLSGGGSIHGRPHFESCRVEVFRDFVDARRRFDLEWARPDGPPKATAVYAGTVSLPPEGAADSVCAGPATVAVGTGDANDSAWEQAWRRTVGPDVGLEVAPEDARGLDDWLEQLGLLGCAAPRKFIPDEVFRLGKVELALLLNRLLAVDGRVRGHDEGKPRLEFHSCSEKLSRQVQHLLVRFGVLAARRRCPAGPDGVTPFKLEITDRPSLRALVEQIGSFGQDPAWESLVRDPNGNDRTADEIHWDVLEEIAFVGMQPVYDLTIPRTHNFVANDICVHNTSLALNIAENISVSNKQPLAFFSLEMSKQQLAQRLLCSRSGVDSHKLRRNMLSADDFGRLSLAVGELSEAPVYIDDTPGLTLLSLRAKSRRLAARHDIKAVFVDYLQLMADPSNRENRQQEVSNISRGIKALARELEVPVVCMSQLNRSPEGREGHRPRMSDLRESGSIEQDADVVMMLHREDYYHKGEESYEETHVAEVIMTKQRNGPTGTVKLHFHGATTRFQNLAAGGQELPV